MEKKKKHWQPTTSTSYLPSTQASFLPFIGFTSCVFQNEGAITSPLQPHDASTTFPNMQPVHSQLLYRRASLNLEALGAVCYFCDLLYSHLNRLENFNQHLLTLNSIVRERKKRMKKCCKNVCHRKPENLQPVIKLQLIYSQIYDFLLSRPLTSTSAGWIYLTKD